MGCSGLRARILAAALICATPVFAGAQEGVPVRSPILVIDSEALYLNSEFGQRLSDEIEAEGAVLAAEQRRIEAELTAEEKELTEQREALSAEEFRALADAFDKKVQRIRAEQDAKTRAYAERGEAARARFFKISQPVLEEIMRATGAAVVIERRTVFLNLDVVDVTVFATRRINEVIGDGTAGASNED